MDKYHYYIDCGMKAEIGSHLKFANMHALVCDAAVGVSVCVCVYVDSHCVSLGIVYRS